jgi:hypothetical protein
MKKTILFILFILFLNFEVLANPIKVMVIDTGIGFHGLLDQYVTYEHNTLDTTGHGTHVAGIIAWGNHHLDDQLCNKVQITACKVYLGPVYLPDAFIGCLVKAEKEDFNYVNISLDGGEFNLKEYELFKKLEKKNVIVTVAAGNHTLNLDKTFTFPASYGLPLISTYRIPIDIPKRFRIRRRLKSKFLTVRPLTNIKVVQNLCLPDQLCHTSNYSKRAVAEYGENIYSTFPNNSFKYMGGTSMSAPAYLHRLLKKECSNGK